MPLAHRQPRPQDPSNSLDQDSAENLPLTFSDAMRPVIVLDAPAHIVRGRKAALEFAWWPVPMSARGVSRLIDALVVLTGILIFCLLGILSTHIFPPWPIAAGLALGVGLIFGGIYWVLFHVCARGTPGQRLAQVATEESNGEKKCEAQRSG